jgi:hypothetical protein
MSTNKTENLQLHQWGAEDEPPQIERELNENFAALDSAVAAVQAAAEAAQAAADAAQTTAETHKNYAVGKYTGNGKETYLELGFRPSLFLVYEYYTTNDASTATGRISMFVDGANGGKLNLSANGVLLYADSGTAYPPVNKAGKTYNYIAFR